MLNAVVDLSLDNTGLADCSDTVQTAIDSGEVLYFPKGSYKFLKKVKIPQGLATRVVGDGFRHSFLKYEGQGSLFEYARDATSGGAVVTFEDLTFVGLKRVNSYAISFQGYGVHKDDNWLRTYRCGFANWVGGAYLKYCGQCQFVDNFYQGNDYSHVLKRGASFVNMKGCMSFDGTFVHAQDIEGDAYSNGLVIDSCNNVTASKENIFVDGWQAVFITGCGWDLGSGGSSALWFRNCQDVYVDKCFISSNQSSTRNAVTFDLTHTGSVTNSTIVNSRVGIQVNGSPSYATKIVVDGNKFEGNVYNDILLLGGSKSIKVVNNHFQTPKSHTGAEYEIFANGDVADNIVAFNTFACVNYPLNVGYNSQVIGNVFNAQP